MKPEHEDLLRRLALNDEGVLESLFGAGFADAQRSELDAKALALVRLAALVVLESAPASYQWTVAAALAAGATDEEIVGVLAALVPIAGTVRVGAAAPEVALGDGLRPGAQRQRVRSGDADGSGAAPSRGHAAGAALLSSRRGDATCQRPRSDGCVDEKTASLARLAALVALHAAPASYERGVGAALAVGATADEVVDTLTAVAPTVGLARVVSAAPGLALALGYDIDRARSSHTTSGISRRSGDRFRACA